MLNPTMPAWAEIPTLDLDRDRRPHGAGLDAPPPRRPLAAPSMPARDAILGALGIAALYTLPDLRAAAVPCRSPAMTLQASSDPSHDFDFLHGRWIVRNRRLRERLVGCADWDAFDGVQACRPILGGLGNEDEFITDAFGADRFIGMSIRLFDPRAREWSIFWVDNRSVQLQPPVRGRFDGSVGTFYGRDVHAGTPVLARFVWTVVSADRARWEQAFSTDEGASWETNWIMEFERSDA